MKQSAHWHAGQRFASALGLAVVVGAAGIGLGGCGGRYHVRLTNETDKTVFAGIVETGPGVNKVHERMTLGPGAEVELSSTREGDEKSRMSLMVGDSPNPRDRAVMRALEEGKNRFVVRYLSPDAPNSSLTVEPDASGWW